MSRQSRMNGGGGRSAIALAALIVAGAVGTARGQLYWSANGSTAGGSGAWDTTNQRWGTAAGGPFTTVWDNTAHASTRAIVQTSPGTVTIQGGGISVGLIEPAGSTWTFDGGPITLGSQIRNVGGGTTKYNATFNNNISLAGGTTFDMRGGSTLTINGQLAGSGALNLSGGGAYQWTLAGDNSGFSGPVTLGGGITGSMFSLGHNNALGTGLVTMDGNLPLQSVSGPLTIGNKFFTELKSNATKTMELAGGHALTFTGEFEIDPTINDGWLRFDVTSAETMTWAGVIKQQSGNARSLVKLGSGTLVLSGANTYKGTTTVEAGTLVIDGDMSGAPGDVSVASGATLGGTGSLGGSVSVPSGATLAVGIDGTTADDLTITGTLTLAGNLDIAHVSDPTQTKYRVATASSIDITGVTVTGDTGWTPELRNGDTELWIAGTMPAGTVYCIR